MKYPLPLGAFVITLVSAGTVAQADEGSLRVQEYSSIYASSVNFNDVETGVGLGLNVGAVTASKDIARGLQKGADIYGITLNLFVTEDPTERREMAKLLLDRGDSYVILDQIKGDQWSEFEDQATQNKIPYKLLAQADSNTVNDGSLSYDGGLSAFREARSVLIDRIPKYDEILPIAFPVSPVPDNFFQPSKFPYPRPLVRVPRTNESASASVHSHTSCNMVAQTGNMLHRTSSIDPDRLLMGMEGGNLSLQATPKAIEMQKLSAVMTSWVLNLADNGLRREILVENNGLGSSLFRVGIHAPEELEIALNHWVQEHKIRSFRIIDHEFVELVYVDGYIAKMRAGLFLVANDRSTSGAKGPVIIQGNDRYGARTLDFYSTQAFVQQLVEVVADRDDRIAAPPSGGILTAAGTTVGGNFGRPLRDMLITMPQKKAPVQPYVMTVEGGFIVVTPEAPLSEVDLSSPVKRVHLDLRGPLTSDQTILVELESGAKPVFRRTVIDFERTDDALNGLRSMGLISGWEYEGVRGRGLFANIVLKNFYGKHRKFMSSLATWPTDERVDRAIIRFYVDGMQRLNFGLITPDGWRQEFVEVPLRVPPVPRDIALFSGRSTLE